MTRKKNYVCKKCNRVFKANSCFLGGTCQNCHNYFAQGGRINKKPEKGEVTYDSRGYPICHICGRAYKKLGAHIFSAHNLTAKEYKIEFGLDRTKGLLDQELKKRLQKNVMDNYEKVVINNLIQKGADTRFRIGSSGRCREIMSIQTMKKLKEKRR